MELQSAIDSAGPQAATVEQLWWFFFWVLGVVYVLVIAALVIAVLRKRRERLALRDAHAGLHVPVDLPTPAAESGTTKVVTVLVGVTAVILVVLLVSEYMTGRSLHNITTEQNPLSIRVIGHQWWWEVHYEDQLTSNMVVTANEMRLPLGKPVLLKLESNDVIHSFWIPNLTGKKDMIPGHKATLWIKADRAGEYRGQCAEFCGLQHAHMRFEVVVEPEALFQKWLTTARKAAPEPETDSQKKGRDVFLSSSCVMCHSISGTRAFGNVGPNLTHVMSRKFIAAGALPNNRGNLAGWIVDPQHAKPGTRMPQNTLPPDKLNALLDYLEMLK